MRAIHINATERTITEVEIGDTGDLLGDMQEAVGGYIERAAFLPNGDEIYVNEMGMMGLEPGAPFFEVRGAHQPFAGSGIVVGNGDATGETTPAVSSVEEVRDAVAWMVLR